MDLNWFGCLVGGLKKRHSLFKEMFNMGLEGINNSDFVKVLQPRKLTETMHWVLEKGESVPLKDICVYRLI